MTALPEGRVVIDLEHLGLPGAIGACLLDGPEPALIDPGPSTTLPTLEAALAELGVPAHDLRHLVLTHVHLDHAGASGHLVRDNPGLTVHVHEDGAPHMANPEKLVASTRRTFGDAHDRLWGEVMAIPAARIEAWRPGEGGPLPYLRALPTPGHIAHHLAYIDETTGTLYSGDSMGIVLGGEAPSHPPTPPPSLDPVAWDRTLDELETVGPERFVATHFGAHESFRERRLELQTRLRELVERVRTALARGDADEDAERYETEVRDRLAEHVDRERVDRYFDMFAAATDYFGVRFYLERNE